MGLFSGKNFLVVGASVGIGAGIAQRLAAEGATVHAAARRVEAIEAYGADCEGKIVAHACDVSDPDSVARLFAKIREVGEPLDALVGAAAVLWFAPFADQPENEWVTMLETNLLGSIRVTQAALQDMLPRDSGHILHITSTAAGLAIPHLAIYSTGKAGLSHFLTALRGEYGTTGVRFTEMHIGNVGGTEGGGAAVREFDPGLMASVEEISRWTGTPEMMRVEDVVEAVVYALSSSSRVRLDKIVLREKANIPT